MKYRKEIDGLRALAVLPVILFHAGFTVFGGGFVGVDIFFVISGYLITTILISEMEQDRFSLANFYDRRARRILPALFFVMLCTLPFAWLWMLPADLKSFSQSLVAVPLFVSNILFYLTSGYFDLTSEFKPLLHTWSLAVEEQYYLLFPIFLMITWKFGKNFITYLLIAATILSVTIAQWASFNYSSFSFYMLPTRGFEILIGALISFYINSKTLNQPFYQLFSKPVNQIGSITGMALILYSIFLFDKNTPSPSLYTLIPTLGAGLIILFANTDNFVGRLLGSKILVWIGLISYSTYLWHQPLLSFARLRSVEELTNVMLVMLCLASLILGYLSWRFVESPFRDRNALSTQKVVIITLPLGILFLVLGVVGHLTKGFESRFQPEIGNIYQPTRGFSLRCDKSDTKVGCKLGSLGTTPTFAMLGDSHSSVLQQNLSDSLELQLKSMVTYYGSWCAPLIDFGTDNVNKNPQCRKFMNDSFDLVLKDSNISTVILVAEWGNYTQGYRWNDSGIAFYTDAQSGTLSAQETIKSFHRALERTIGLLKENRKKVIIVKSVPEYEEHLPTYIAKSIAFDGGLPEDVDDKMMNYELRNADFENVLSKLKEDGSVTVVDTEHLFCKTGNCTFIDETNEMLYIDGNHLSKYGSRILVEDIINNLK
ncbi:acyltransferase family protein [Rheinheimera sp. MM224]|uniref:acyltransferase family protein n=1 Tax=Rheinheimera sp. MM224 TaxID=3019969 RepID=UPI0021F83EB7|nr:acyltransferase family protein [Rheinheimera sp. MM224]CAI3796585.1 hypothetical protein JAMGFMIE_01604 [Rheinheimera sp. MM224]